MCFGGDPKPAPAAPVVQQIPVQATEEVKSANVENAVTTNQDKLKRYAGQSSTLLTNPLGLQDQAQVQKKTLLGQ